MTVSRANRRGTRTRQAVAGLVAACAMGTASAYAQAPLTTYDPETMELAEPVIPGNDIKVEVKDLKAVSGESAGALDQAHGGFPSTLWAGTSAAVVRKLIPMLPGSPASQVVRGLERRLLLTAAVAPDGAVEGDRPSLVDLRAERLATMGDSEGVMQLAAVAPHAVEGSLMQRVKLDAELLAGNTQGACADAPKDGSQPKLMVLCNYLAGKTLEGNLGLDLLHERKDPDQAFIAAAEVLSGLPPVPAAKLKLDEVTPLHVAAFAAAKMPLPADAVAKASPAVAKAVSMSFATDYEVRLTAGERAAAAGVLSADSLRKLYTEATFSADELGAPLAKADGVGARGRALMFRAAMDQSDPVLRGQFIAKALDLGAAKGQLTLTAQVFALMLGSLQPDPALTSAAPAFALANLALGRDAGPWLSLAKSDPATAKAAARLWPLSAALTASPGQAVDTAGLIAWRNSLNGVAPEVAARRAAMVVGCLTALGAKVPETAWLDALSLPPTAGPNVALFGMLQGAALDARLGATLLAALAGIGDQPLDKANIISVTEAVSALTVVGQGADARKLAIEAMLANGL